MRDGQVLGLTSIYSVISELRTPILELKMLAEAGDLRASREVAKQTLELFDNFLYAQELEKEEKAGLDYLPHSLAAATEDVIDKVAPFADLYGVGLEFETGPAKKMGVSLVKKAFDCATHSLLYSLISSLQNKPKASLRIRTAGSGLPSLRFFSQDIDDMFRDGHVTDVSAKSRLNPHCPGIASGLMLANFIYRRVGSKLSFIANQHGRGLGVDFRPTRQMALVESLS